MAFIAVSTLRIKPLGLLLQLNPDVTGFELFRHQFWLLTSYYSFIFNDVL
jgi:hypothetical protein